MKKLLNFIRSLFVPSSNMEYYKIERVEKFDKEEAKKKMEEITRKK